MNATKSLLSGLALAALAALPAFAGEGEGAKKDDPAPASTRDDKAKAAVDALVKDLGSDDFKIREAATESLIALGDAAKPALEAALKSADPEVKSRAERCLKSIARGGDDADAEDEEPAERPSRSFRLSRRGEGGPPPFDPNELIEELEKRMWEGGPTIRFFDPNSTAEASSTVHIRIQEEGKSWTYSEDPENGVEARVAAPGAEEEVITAKSRAEFVEKHPDLAKKLGIDEPSGALEPRALARRFGPLEPRTPFLGQTARGPRLGVAVEPIDATTAKRLGVDPPSGVVVLEVEAGSTADSLGLEPDDVLLELNGEAIADATALRKAVRKLEAGDEIRLDLVRSGDRRTVKGRL